MNRNTRHNQNVRFAKGIVLLLLCLLSLTTALPVQAQSFGNTLNQLLNRMTTVENRLNGNLTLDNLVPSLRDPLSLLGASAGSPVLRDTVGTNFDPAFVAISGRYAYLVNAGSSTLQVFDLINPATPVLRNTVATGSRPTFVAVSGSYVYVTNINQDSIQVFDISDPVQPILRNTVQTEAAPDSIAIRGNYAYVLNANSNTLQVFDISDPTNPTPGNSIATESAPRYIAISGNIAVVAAIGNNKLQLFDLSNPSTPTLRQTIGTQNTPWSLAIAGNLVYVLNRYSNTLQVFDISNPDQPVLRGTANTAGEPLFAAIKNNTIYVTCGTGNVVQAFDISNPATPVLRGAASTLSYPYHIAIAGDYAYIANILGNTFQVFDLVGGTPTLNVAGDLFVNGSGIFSGTLTQLSDARFKHDVAPILNPLNTLLQLHGVTYFWNEDKPTSARQIGFLAQEVEKVLPELVVTDSRGYKSVAYANAVPVLVEALKTLKAEKDAEIAELKAQVQALTEAVRQLQSTRK